MERKPDFSWQDSPIFVGNLAETLGPWLKEQSYSQILVLTDTHTHVQCLPLFQDLLPYPFHTIQIPSGEQHKNLDTCTQIWQQMLIHKLDRKSLLINLGGGVIGDMGGFCAATWKRGIDFIQVPTTLLSMTDAAIGGKTGIDFQGIKNTIGVFQTPAAVFADPAFLHTLSDREFISGLAEVIKHGFIGAPQLLENFINLQPAALRNLPWTQLLGQSIAVKVRVVTEDPKEKGLRMLLNYGHSIGHAIESYFLETDNPLTHGEAVAIGMICETPPPHQTRVAQILAPFFPKVTIPNDALPVLWQLMQQDKKNSSGAVRLAIPDELPYTLNVLEITEQHLSAMLHQYTDASY
ncbi:MAG TPA: 3-dehydroquinate synthase [Saprospiraceae bacterium]|nr:3-dehydroquinate synthase [Saprospiraceae bacterium]